MLYGAETGTSSLPKKGSGCLTPGLALSPVPSLGTCSCGRGQVSHPHQRLRAHTSQPREAPVQSQSKSTPANTQGMPLGAFWFLKNAQTLCLGHPPSHSTGVHPDPAPRCSRLRPAPALQLTPATSFRAQLAGCKMLMGSSLPAATSSVAAFLLVAPLGILRSLRRSRSLQILGCFLPSFLTVRNQRPGEKTILSANYHDYPIMAILDEFLMKCALVSSGFHNFQVQPFHPSDLLHKDFFSPAKERSASGREGGPSPRATSPLPVKIELKASAKQQAD